MNDKKFDQLTYTLLISSILLIGCLIAFYCLRQDIFSDKGDFSAQIRNVALSSVAISSIPFLIFGHINRREDIRIKKTDQRFKSESDITDKIYSELRPELDVFQKLLSEKISLSTLENNTTSIQLQTWTYNSVNNTILNSEDHFEDSCIEQIAASQFWPKIKTTVKSINGLLDTLELIKNEKLRALILRQLVSKLSATELLSLYFLTLLTDYYEGNHHSSSRLITLYYSFEEISLNHTVVKEKVLPQINSLHGKTVLPHPTTLELL